MTPSDFDEHSGSRARPGGSARPMKRAPGSPVRLPAAGSSGSRGQGGSRLRGEHPSDSRGQGSGSSAASGERSGEPRTRRMPAQVPSAARQEHGSGAAVSGFSSAHSAELSPDTSGGHEDNPRDLRSPERSRRSRRHLSRRGRLLRTLGILLVLLLAWPIGLGFWADARIQHVDALSDAPNTPGTTYLLAGADLGDNGAAQRTDTIMLLHKAPNGQSYLVSIPRDTLVDIPGRGKYKINAAYAFGGPSLLVKTVEQFTGLTIDHFVTLGFDGVKQVTDAVGHVNLCIDQDVDDPKSELKMTKGCHDVAGDQALAFVRARYFDPRADLGRQERQQQFVSSLMKRTLSPTVLFNPVAHVKLATAAGDSLETDPSTGLIDVARIALTMRSATGAGNAVPMPIENPAFQTRHSGVAIKVDDAEVAQFFQDIQDGTLDVEKAKQNAF